MGGKRWCRKCYRISGIWGYLSVDHRELAFAIFTAAHHQFAAHLAALDIADHHLIAQMHVADARARAMEGIRHAATTARSQRDRLATR